MVNSYELINEPSDSRFSIKSLFLEPSCACFIFEEVITKNPVVIHFLSHLFHMHCPFLSGQREWEGQDMQLSLERKCTQGFGGRARKEKNH
jgi:hypothetical protein